MPDGSNWALQAWQRDLPDNGWSPKNSDRVRLGAAREPLVGPAARPLVQDGLDYATAPGGPFDHLYGTFTYNGHPVYGFSSSSAGAPTDSFGRLVSMDTLNPPWKRGYRQVGGWYRYNTFLTHRPYGDFCTGVFGAIADVPHAHAARPRHRVPHHRQRARRDARRRRGATTGRATTCPASSNLFPTRNMRGPYSAQLDHELNADQRAIDPVPTGPNSCYHTHYGGSSPVGGDVRQRDAGVSLQVAAVAVGDVQAPVALGQLGRDRPRATRAAVERRRRRRRARGRPRGGRRRCSTGTRPGRCRSRTRGRRTPRRGAARPGATARATRGSGGRPAPRRRRSRRSGRHRCRPGTNRRRPTPAARARRGWARAGRR